MNILSWNFFSNVILNFKQVHIVDVHTTYTMYTKKLNILANRLEMKSGNTELLGLKWGGEGATTQQVIGA